MYDSYVKQYICVERYGTFQSLGSSERYRTSLFNMTESDSNIHADNICEYYKPN